MIRTDDEASGDGLGAPPVVWLSFDEYDDLWRWSADALEDFWDAVWQFFGVPASAGYSSVLSSRVMPGAVGSSERGSTTPRLSSSARPGTDPR